jgi:hypothetical protein
MPPNYGRLRDHSRHPLLQSSRGIYVFQVSPATLSLAMLPPWALLETLSEFTGNPVFMLQRSMGDTGWGEGEETNNIPVEPDDSTPIHALQGLAVYGLASGTSRPTGWLVVSEVGAED